MPWLETDVRDQRLQFVLAVRRGRDTIAALCRAFGVSRQTGHKWLRREADAGSLAALADRSRRPHHSPTRTEAATTERVLAARDYYGWGGAKLAHVLAAEGVYVTARTIDRLIQREGRTRRDAAPAPAPHRFERAACNELWQLDAKGAYPLSPQGRCHPLSLLDDHSRYAIGLEALPTLSTATVAPALIACFRRFGVPDAMLMDHGTPWWAAPNPDGLTALAVLLLKQGIRLVYGAVRHPQTQGKVERFHRTLGERLRWQGVPRTLPAFATALRRFRTEYNEHRPHAALGMDPPARHFTPSARPYRPRPRPWDYPSDVAIRRVHHTGVIRYDSAVYFVSEALRGEDVACLPVEDRVLVMYRHMYVRELHLRTQRSVPLLLPTSPPRPSAAGPS